MNTNHCCYPDLLNWLSDIYVCVFLFILSCLWNQLNQSKRNLLHVHCLVPALWYILVQNVGFSSILFRFAQIHKIPTAIYWPFSQMYLLCVHCLVPALGYMFAEHWQVGGEPEQVADSYRHWDADPPVWHDALLSISETLCVFGDWLYAVFTCIDDILI